MSNENLETKAVEEKFYYHGTEAVVRKLCFASGEFVYQLPWMLVSSFLAIFMTDVALIPAGIVSALFLLCRVWDAVNDPLIGTLSDRTNTKMGRYRPWMLAGAIGMIPLVVLMFWAHPDWPVGARSAYGCILYFLGVVFCTCWQIPYTAMNGVISPNPKERASFSSVRVFCSSLACAFATGVFTPMVKHFAGAEGNMARGYFMATLIECAIAIPFVFTFILGTKEVVKAPKKQKSKMGFKQIVNVFAKNPPLLILMFAYLVNGFLVYGRMTVSAFYFTYVWGGIGWYTLFATANGFITAGGAMLAPFVLKVFKSKRKSMMFTFAGTAILHGILFFMTPANCTVMTSIVVRWCTGIFGGLTTAFLYSFIGDAVDYGQWKTGVRADALCASGTTLMTKLGGAIGPSLLLALLAVNGYVPNAAEQTTSALNTLNGAMNLLPLGMAAVAMLLFSFYKLDDKLHAQVVKELKERGEYDVA